MSGITIFDNFLDDIDRYREHALSLEFKSYDFGHCVFHGIAVGGRSAELPGEITRILPNLTPSLTFFRKSPEGQVEPHFIHTDIDMGDWSGILYLNPEPPKGDGTTFWTHKGTQSIKSLTPHERSEEGNTPSHWEPRKVVQAKFNRLLMFPSSYFHSRNIHENWGEGESARLTQVTFGKGSF